MSSPPSSRTCARSLSSRIERSYRGSRCCFQCRVTSSISPSETNTPWARVGLGESGGSHSMSPRPRSFSAPVMSMIVRESTAEAVANATRAGMLALIRPVMTSTDGRCVATTRWMPVARASCEIRVMAFSTWIGADIIRSASSSISSTTYGMRSGPVRDSLYFSMFRAVARAKRRYRRSISPIAQYSALRILS